MIIEGIEDDGAENICLNILFNLQHLFVSPQILRASRNTYNLKKKLEPAPIVIIVLRYRVTCVFFFNK